MRLITHVVCFALRSINNDESFLQHLAAVTIRDADSDEEEHVVDRRASAFRAAGTQNKSSKRHTLDTFWQHTFV
jgi:hypothetical protein